MSDTSTRRYGRSAGLLSVGIGTTGLVTYGYFSLANHALTEEAYGGITLLWSAVFIVVSILYRPVEQLLSRTLAERQIHSLEIRTPLRVAAAIQIALAVLFLISALTLRGAIEDGLFGGSATLYWVMTASVLAYAVSYFARGFLAGQQHFGLYSALVFMEATSRILFAVAAVIGLSGGLSTVALGVFAGPTVSLFVVPLAFRRRAKKVVAATAVPSEEATDEFTLARGGGFAAAVLLIMVSEQTFLNAGPLIVKLTEGSSGTALAGFVFSLLLVFRAPVQLFQAIATSLLPHLTGLRATEGHDSFQRSVRITVIAIAAFAVSVVGLMLAVGPPLMELFFPKYSFDRVGLALIGTGTGVYLTAATLNQAALAHERARQACYCWLVAAAVFVVWLATVPIASVGRRVEIGFVLTAALLAGLLYLLQRQSHRN